MTKNSLVFLPHVLGIFTWFIGPLIAYLVGEGDMKEHSKKALNWQLSLLIYYLISLILTLILIGVLALFVLGVLNLVFCIMGAVKAADGEIWDYPLTINFLK